MANPLRPEDIAQHPNCVTETFDFAGEPVTFRVLQQGDGPLFGRYLEGLSEATRQCFSPHAFTMETAQGLCDAIDYTDTLRLIGTAGEGAQERMIAYFILTLGARESEIKRFSNYSIALDPDTDCRFAPSMADAYQNRGLGTVLAERVLAVAGRLSYTRVVLQGGTQKANLRGIHFYEKLGFRKVGAFTTSVENQDMMCVL